MKIYSETSLENFGAWSGAIETLNRVIDEGKADELENILTDLYPDGMDETQLNDILWFESDWIYETLGISEEEEEEEEDIADFNDFCNQFSSCDECPYYHLETVTNCKDKWEEDNEK